MKGVKYDNGKLRFGLLPIRAIEAVTRVLMHGAEKYEDNNWQRVTNANERYYEAALRHLFAWKRGDKIDSESGLPHLAHCATCLLFMIWHDEQAAKPKRDPYETPMPRPAETRDGAGVCVEYHVSPELAGMLSISVDQLRGVK